MTEYLAWCSWLAAAFLLGILEELFRARRVRVGGRDESSRRFLCVALSKVEATRLELSSGPPRFGYPVNSTDSGKGDLPSSGGPA